MKKIILLFVLISITILPANADIVKISATDAVHLALENNLELQAKRKEIDILKQEVKMANAFRLAVEGGRDAFLGKTGPVSEFANASSPLTGFLGKF